MASYFVCWFLDCLRIITPNINERNFYRPKHKNVGIPMAIHIRTLFNPVTLEVTKCCTRPAAFDIFYNSLKPVPLNIFKDTITDYFQTVKRRSWFQPR